MQRILQLLQAVTLTALIVLLCSLIVSLRAFRPKAEAFVRDAHVTVLEIGLTAKNLREASQTWKQASKEQSIQTTLAMSRVSAAAARLSSFITGADRSINANLLPTLADAIKSQSAALLASEDLLNGNLSEMSKATQQAQKVLVDADAQITDPHIKASLMNLDAASANLTEASEQVTATATDVRLVADKFREEYTKPVSIWWALAKQLIGLGGSMAQMIK